MVKRLRIQNFTVFAAADLRFGKHLNVIVGENGAGKTHLLKLVYSVLAASWQEGNELAPAPKKAMLQTRLARKLVNVFRPESLGRLVRRKQGRERCDVHLSFADSELDIQFQFANNSMSEVAISSLPFKWLDVAPTYLPTRELLTIFPSFASVYNGHYLEFEETWFDTCLLLGGLLQHGPRAERIQDLLAPLERAMGGNIEFDENGRFYLRTESGRMEMPLVAEGLRKLGMIARLVATGALLDRGYLFWDMPEANLNPRLIKQVARTIVDLSQSGIQVFIATHSLFLMRELQIILAGESYREFKTRYFGLQPSEDGIQVLQGATLDDIGGITALEESLQQSDRYLAL